MEIRVECHSGYAYAQRPAAFWWQQERLEVAELLAEMNLPGAKRFIVTTKDHRRWVIEYQIDADVWLLIEMTYP